MIFPSLESAALRLRLGSSTLEGYLGNLKVHLPLNGEESLFLLNTANRVTNFKVSLSM